MQSFKRLEKNASMEDIEVSEFKYIYIYKSQVQSHNKPPITLPIYPISSIMWISYQNPKVPIAQFLMPFISYNFRKT